MRTKHELGIQLHEHSVPIYIYIHIQRGCLADGSPTAVRTEANIKSSQNNYIRVENNLFSYVYIQWFLSKAFTSYNSLHNIPRADL